jgi:uncharacterized RDD family membrane protein YckC
MNLMSEKNYLPASLWRRLAAMVYDFLLIVAVSFLYYAIAIGVNVLFNGVPEQGKPVDWGHFKFLVFTGWILTIAGFFCFFWTRSGQTLGMKTWNLKIVNQHNQYPNYQQSFLRCVIASFSLLFFGIGYWWIFFNPEHQTLHDKLTHTKTFLVEKNNE